MFRISTGEVDVLSAEQLHAEQRKDDDEEKDEKQQRHDGLHAVEKRQDQIAQRRPVPSHNVRRSNNNKCSAAVAEMGDRLATIDMGRKLGAVPLLGGAWSPSNTMSPVGRDSFFEPPNP